MFYTPLVGTIALFKNCCKNSVIVNIYFNGWKVIICHWVYIYTRQFDIASNPMTKLYRIWTTEVQDSCYVQIVFNVVQIDNVLVLTFIWNGPKRFL